MIERDPQWILRQKNPLPEPRFPADEASRAINASGEDVAKEGYRVLDRAEPRDPWNPNRPGLAEPVRRQQGDPDWDAGTRYGSFT